MGNFDLDNYITIHSNTFRLALSVLVLMLMLLLRSVVRKRIKNLSILHSYEAHRLLLIRKITAILFWIVLGVVILTIWGVNLENIWVYIGSFITLVAVAFFAAAAFLAAFALRVAAAFFAAAALFALAATSAAAFLVAFALRVAAAFFAAADFLLFFELEFFAAKLIPCGKRVEYKRMNLALKITTTSYLIPLWT